MTTVHQKGDYRPPEGWLPSTRTPRIAPSPSLQLVACTVNKRHSDTTREATLCPYDPRSRATAGRSALPAVAFAHRNQHPATAPCTLLLPLWHRLPASRQWRRGAAVSKYPCIQQPCECSRSPIALLSEPPRASRSTDRRKNSDTTVVVRSARELLYPHPVLGRRELSGYRGSWAGFSSQFFPLAHTGAGDPSPQRGPGRELAGVPGAGGRGSLGGWRGADEPLWRADGAAPGAEQGLVEDRFGPGRRRCWLPESR